MPITFSCSQCERKFTVKNELAGKKTKCPCGLILTIPDDSELVLPPVLSPVPPPIPSKPYADIVSPDNPFITPSPKPVVPVPDNPFTPPPKSIQDIRAEVYALAENTKETIKELEGIKTVITVAIIAVVIFFVVVGIKIFSR